MEHALQDIAKVHCYGCGALNGHGLQIKSFWAGDDVVDCHCIWTACAYAHRAAGVPIEGTLRYAYVTAALKVNFRKPVPIGNAIDLRARVTEFGERKAIVHCKVSSQGILCAEAEVVAVRTPVPQPAAEAVA